MLQGVLFVNVWHRSLTTQAQSLWPRFQQSTTRHWPTLTVEFVASVCHPRSHWLTGSKSPGGQPMRAEITAAGPWQNRSSAECWKLYPVDCEMKVVPETSPRNLIIYILDIYISILRRRKWQQWQTKMNMIFTGIEAWFKMIKMWIVMFLLFLSHSTVMFWTGKQ